MSLERLGNMPKGYENPQKRVLRLGTFEHPVLYLKLYEMFNTGATPSEGYTALDMRNFINGLVEEGNLHPEIGLGFAILSEDALNLVRWKSRQPVVAINDLYGFSRKDGHLQNFEELDIREFGGFCLWEARILSHEGKAWEKYLASKRTVKDKRAYLDATIEGDLL